MKSIVTSYRLICMSCLTYLDARVNANGHVAHSILFSTTGTHVHQVHHTIDLGAAISREDAVRQKRRVRDVGGRRDTGLLHTPPLVAIDNATNTARSFRGAQNHDGEIYTIDVEKLI